LAEPRIIAEVPAFDPLGSISGLGSKVTGAGSEVSLIRADDVLGSFCQRLHAHPQRVFVTFHQAFGNVTSHIPDFSISDKVPHPGPATLPSCVRVHLVTHSCR
jgi:hypothetical protein